MLSACLQLTPVAKLQPVELAGVVIKNVTLHNAGHIREMQLAPGDVVTIERAGDVIPKVSLRLSFLRGRHSALLPGTTGISSGAASNCWQSSPANRCTYFNWLAGQRYPGQHTD